MVEQMQYEQVAFMTPRHDTKAVTKETGARFSKNLKIFRAKKLGLVNPCREFYSEVYTPETSHMK